MEKSTLIIGGARSGKSQLAEKLALKPMGRAVYIATAEARDEEMSARIATHRARRGDNWSDVHAPVLLPEALVETDGDAPRLVDCLTLWLSNLMLAGDDWRAATEALVEVLATQTADVIFVTNEVGAGIVPENKLARDFRDAAGWVNQRVAQASDTVWLCVAGYPVKVKPNDNI
ncbi:bifunctional adenosylcobinamide kinase/adenosylcobinamide-phosphate guanylyltransferase [Lentibacter algarum]|uniref:bifunctional adenosylcobinamide kinase/adenosylcobinamide-phosphate guanylyltransferase n=1 Tax=Lentibacter algarum TaxID=576131 RepID=UPI001C0711B8|nr:bifunctional adenosylcobinamide kinase/adenosylcobinamide-phosphate guanylyltransferase [Lentibacter algarum]MBU2981667.1 bifunctional adenosylcobinamide kinase/adenosylcobinamide-phosphate guanylyltransferase [Lentibacter algarum]